MAIPKNTQGNPGGTSFSPAQGAQVSQEKSSMKKSQQGQKTPEQGQGNSSIQPPSQTPPQEVEPQKGLHPGHMVQNFTKDFVKFLNEYSVLGIAMGLVIGAAVNSLVQSIVNGLITPFIQLIMPANFLKDLTYEVHDVTFAIGPIINAVINFLIVALLFFIFARVFLRKKEVTRDIFK